MGIALEVVSTVMPLLVHSVLCFVLAVAILPAFSVTFLSVVVMFGDATEAGNQRKSHLNK